MKKFTAQVSDGTTWLTAIGTETGVSVRFGRSASTDDQHSFLIAWFLNVSDFSAWAYGAQTPLEAQLHALVMQKFND